MKKLFLYILALLAVIKVVTISTGCANIVPPEGGARDTIPPVLERSSPPNHTVNFTGNRITMTFDEYVDLDNYQQNVLMSPLPNIMPAMTRKLNTVTIKFNDSVTANTTYSIDFGNSIKDVNEGNVMKNFVYTISTGPYIDSLEFSGKVILAQTGDIDSTLSVMLYREKDDSAIIQKRPRYITKLDRNGHFTFHNLSPGSFYVYAMKDEGSHRYMGPDQLFAFADRPYEIKQNPDTVTLYAYATEKAALPPPTSTGGRGARSTEKRLKFVTNASGKMDLLEKFTFTFETPLKNFDSSKITVATDTNYVPITNFHWQLDTTRRKLSLINEWKENTEYHVIVQKDFATDTLGYQLLKPDTLHFSTRARSEYGNVKIRFRNLDLSKNPVILFVPANTADVKYAFPLTSNILTASMIEPGDYNLRLLSDTNKNGKWDPGVFFGKHQQPEIVKPVARRVTTIRAIVDNEFEIILNN